MMKVGSSSPRGSKSDFYALLTKQWEGRAKGHIAQVGYYGASSRKLHREPPHWLLIHPILLKVLKACIEGIVKRPIQTT